MDELVAKGGSAFGKQGGGCPIHGKGRCLQECTDEDRGVSFTSKCLLLHASDEIGIAIFDERG